MIEPRNHYIVFKLVEKKDPDGDTEALYFEVHSDSLVLARVEVTDYYAREELARELYEIYTDIRE